MSASINVVSYSFGPFRLCPAEHLLLRGDTPVPLAPKAFELLSMLAAQHGHLITRDELMKAIWPDSFVEEINLTVNISLLRKLLGEQPDGKAYIATVPKRGYRFDAPVVENSRAARESAEPAAFERNFERNMERNMEPLAAGPGVPLLAETAARAPAPRSHWPLMWWA